MEWCVFNCCDSVKVIFTWLWFLVGGLVMAQVPLPSKIKLGEWRTRPLLSPELSFHLDQSDQILAFEDALEKLGRVKRGDDAGDSFLQFERGELPKGVTYRIRSNGKLMEVIAASDEGLAHALSTLLQMVQIKDGMAWWPSLDIEDGPATAYRSFMVDMGRNPHSPKILRQVVDMMWLAKANYLHLHLTDDQICSWPSRAFPKIYSKQAGWTWEDFEALEKYSQARGVTIIPEFDMPGHSTIFRREYPEIFGKTPTDLATSPEAQKGVEILIREALSVFKSTPYYHMGGDEAYGVSQELQRDFINRVNKFVKSQGRQLLVWEGPHLGKGKNKVDEDVIHIIWRNIEVPAQTALDAGYQVVNAPWDPLYIVDHYPRTMFTAVDLERCYHWNPRRWAHINHGMKTFHEPHFTKTKAGILGFCMPWWEGREENILPICYERFTAVAAKAWNPEGEKDFTSYQKRQAKVTGIFEKISGYQKPSLPVADPESQRENLAYLGKVTPSAGASQPHFGPQRLTNGIPDRFDHFLGFPTQPKPLEIKIELKKPAELSRIKITERAIGKSHEIYEVFVSADGENYEKVGESKEGTRGEKNYVDYAFPARKVAFIKISTQGCHGLTFPSFSRLSEVEAFAP